MTIGRCDRIMRRCVSMSIPVSSDLFHFELNPKPKAVKVLLRQKAQGDGAKRPHLGLSWKLKLHDYRDSRDLHLRAKPIPNLRAECQIFCLQALG
jgi:hypothetical protein